MCLELAGKLSQKWEKSILCFCCLLYFFNDTALCDIINGTTISLMTHPSLLLAGGLATTLFKSPFEQLQNFCPPQQSGS